MRNFTSALALAGTLALGSTAALAMPVTHTLTATIDANDIFEVPNPINLNGGVAGTARLQIVPITYSGFPFTLNDGDTLEIDYSVINGGLTLNDLGFGLDELVTFGGLATNSPFDPLTDNPGQDTVLTFDHSTTVTLSNFAGDYPGNPLTWSDSAINFAPTVSMAMRGNFTDSSVTLFDFSISRTFTNIVFQPGFGAFSGPITATGFTGSALFLDELTPAPAPGALALMGFGLFGLIAARRRAS